MGERKAFYESFTGNIAITRVTIRFMISPATTLLDSRNGRENGIGRLKSYWSGKKGEKSYFMHEKNKEIPQWVGVVFSLVIMYACGVALYALLTYK